MTDRQLELRLQAWYRAEVPGSETAPGSLRASVLAIPTATQLPHPHVATWSRLQLLAAAALISVLVAGLLVAGGTFRLVEPVPSASPSPTTPLTSPADTPNPTPVDTRSAAEPPQPGMFASLVTLRAASDRVAWVKTETTIYRTEDTGATWRVSQPPDWATEFSDGFVDADTAYVPTHDGDTINVTHDGGATWTSTVLDARGFGEPVFSYASATSVFATYVDPDHFAKADGTGLRIFGTTDGGATWTGPTTGLQPHLEASFNKVEAAIGGLLISSAGKSDTEPFQNWFNLSADGGQTYTRYGFPVGPLAPKNALKTVDGVLREARGRLLIAVRADGGRTALPQAVYESGTEPDSWRLVYEEPILDGSVEFLSDASWVLTSGSPSEVRTTADGGGTWTTVARPDDVLTSASPQFATPQTGWVRQQCQWALGSACGPSFDEAQALLLLVTKDGGVTWTVVGS